MLAAGALEKSGLRLVSSELPDADGLYSCLRAPDCRPAFVEGTGGADLVVVLLLPKNHTAAPTVRLFTSSGDLVASATGDATAEALQQIPGLVEKVMRDHGGGETAAGHATLVVRSLPPGAIVTIDGEAIGATDLESKVTAGEHTVELTRDGYRPVRRTVKLRDGEDESLLFTLQADATANETPGASRPRWPMFAVGAGGLLVATGILLVVVDQPEIEDGVAHVQVRDTKGWGYASVATGVALAGVGVWGWLSSDEPEAATRAGMSIEQGGATLHVAGRF